MNGRRPAIGSLPAAAQSEWPQAFPVVAMLALFLCAAARADDGPCRANSPHYDQVQCLAGRIEAAQATLDGPYRAALEELADSDPTDSRKGKAQLTKAQAAWRASATEHCNFVGAVQGGSNLWVTNFAMDSCLEELEKRIDFFRHVPRGG